MSSEVLSTPLTPQDLLLLRGVLDDAALETGRRNVAALLIIRLFQSGLTSPKKLGEVVQRCIPDDAEICEAMRSHRVFAIAEEALAQSDMTLH